MFSVKLQATQNKNNKLIESLTTALLDFVTGDADATAVRCEIVARTNRAVLRKDILSNLTSLIVGAGPGERVIATLLLEWLGNILKDRHYLDGIGVCDVAVADELRRVYHHLLREVLNAPGFFFLSARSFFFVPLISRDSVWPVVFDQGYRGGQRRI